jgi:ribose 5-phosphate isomerase A
MDAESKKKLAALKSLDFIPPGTKLGVGTGSTVRFLIDELPAIADRVECFVSSSRDTTKLLEGLGLEVTTLNEAGKLDVYVDGADEATKRLNLIKGGGGALTREKVIAAAARRFVCIIDDSKLVGMLGKFPLPVEVIPMAQQYVTRQLMKLRCQPVWREGFVTDNGNHILDVHNLAISNPPELESRLNQIPGVVTVGIFANRPADILLIGGEDGVRELRV